MQKVILLFVVSLMGFGAAAQKKKTVLPEQVYAQQLAGALQSENLATYKALMPAAELLAPLTPVLPKLLRHSGLDSAELLSDGYQMALERSAARNFQRILEQGKSMGIRWQTALLARYELVKSLKTRDSLLERLVPERYRGFLFITDPYLRKTFCIGLADLFFQDGKGLGGMMTRIFPAVTVSDYENHLEKALAVEAKGLVYDLGHLPEEETAETTDSAAAEDAPVLPKGIVSERRYYRGYFDDDTRIELYLRGYAGDCGESTCRWVAVMHIGDEDEWLPMQVVQKDSVWIFTEMPEKAVMELILSNEQFVGSWQSSADNTTGYEVELSVGVPSKRKYREADDALNEHGL